jgi:hypothetical protein
MSNGLSIAGSMVIPTDGGGSQLIAVSTTSAQSATFSDNTTCYMHNTVGVYVRQGTNPTALATGVDHWIPPGTWRLTGIVDENKLAFICKTGESGSVHLTPGA